VVCTVSPLWLHHADRVVLLQDGQVVADGEHADLLATDPAYRSVVARSLDDADEGVPR
jgi:ABC-type multidrug transport system fused ATPase/permease subunit